MPFPPGSKFPYQPSLTLQLKLLKLYTPSDVPTTTIRVRIQHLFEPPSRACVMLVDIALEDAQRCSLPQQAILKVCDRRFQQERLRDKRLGWTVEKEVAAQNKWSSVEKAPLEYPRIADRHWREAVIDMDPALAEDYFQKSSHGNYLRELAAYETLRELYGTIVPTFYASARLEPSSFLVDSGDLALPKMDEEYAPHAILMEYIPNGRSLEDAHSLTPSQKQQFRDALKQLHHLGVRHGDMKPDNLLLTEERAVFIDFGYAGLKEKEADFEDKCRREMESLESILDGTCRPTNP